MSIFDSFTSWELLRNTKQLTQTKKYNQKKEQEIEDYKDTKQYRAEIRKEMTDEEYHNWSANDYMRRKREQVNQRTLERYHKLEEEVGYIPEELVKNLPSQPDNRSVDEKYLDEHAPLLKNKEWRARFARWGSRLYKLNYAKLLRFDWCIRLLQNYDFDMLIDRQMRMQHKAYDYMKPYMDDLMDEGAWIQTENRVTVCPMWHTTAKLLDVITKTDIPRHQLCEMYLALKKNVYMKSCMYLWNVSFLIWEIIVDSYGHMFMPSLEHNIWWLNKDTVDSLYNMRMDWLRCKTNEAPPIVVLYNASLIKVPKWKIQLDEDSDEFSNCWQYDYYIVCKSENNKANKQWTLDKILQKQHLFFKKKN